MLSALASVSVRIGRTRDALKPEGVRRSKARCPPLRSAKASAIASPKPSPSVFLLAETVPSDANVSSEMGGAVVGHGDAARAFVARKPNDYARVFEAFDGGSGVFDEVRDDEFDFEWIGRNRIGSVVAGKCVRCGERSRVSFLRRFTCLTTFVRLDRGVW